MDNLNQFFFKRLFFLGALAHLAVLSGSVWSRLVEPDKSNYLGDVVRIMNTEWPKNRTVRIVCHGHSVPAGYFKTPLVQSMKAYPHLLQEALAERFPLAVVNVIVTAIGGENAEQGAKRFDQEVLSLHPDVLTIDYSLNDRGLGLEKARLAWSEMIEKAKIRGIKIFLLTPTPDLSASMDDPADPICQHSRLVRDLGRKYDIPVIDSFVLFQTYARAGGCLQDLMSQINHPNAKGHQLIADALLSWFPVYLPPATPKTP